MAAWTTTPRTWAVGEILTAANMNGQLHDFQVAFGTWGSYAPTLSGFTAGNGTWNASYMQAGKHVEFAALFTFGSTSTAAATPPAISLPVSSVATYSGYLLAGTASCRDASASAIYAMTPRQISGTYVYLYVPGANGGLGTPSTTSPFTWTTSDTLHVAGGYEAA